MGTPGVCTECDLGYTLDGSVCVENCVPGTGCKECDTLNEGWCDTCIENLSLNLNINPSNNT